MESGVAGFGGAEPGSVGLERPPRLSRLIKACPG